MKQKYIKQGAEEAKRKYEGGDLKDAPMTEEDDAEDAPITEEEPIKIILRSEAKKKNEEANEEAKPRRSKKGKGTNEEKDVRQSNRRQ